MKKKTASIPTIVLILLMVLLAGIAQLFIKQGVNTVTSGLGHFPTNIAGFFRLVFYWPVFLGLVIYVFFGIAWLKILSDVPVSFAFPFLAISYLVIIIGSYLFLDETITPLKVAAILLISGGVICLSRSDTSEHGTG